MNPSSSWVGTSSKKLRWIVEERLDKFVSPHYWTDVNLCRKRMYPERKTGFGITISSYSLPYDPENFSRCCPIEDVLDQDFTPASVGDSFGPTWSTHWFRLEISIPEEWEGKEVHLLWDSGCEAMIWSPETKSPLQGLTGGGGANERHAYIIDDKVKGGETKILYVEMACNDMGGVGKNDMIGPPDNSRTYTISACEIAVFERAFWDLYWDFVVVMDIANELKEQTRGQRALRAANAATNMIDAKDRATWEDGRQLLQSFLKDTNADNTPEIYAVGHCHIDSAWLWRCRESHRKCARSWSTQLELMKHYPDLTFVCSQAQQYEWVKTDYPQLYSRIKTEVLGDKQRFLPQGGTWVEMDCNIPCGESMVRQFLYGQRFFFQEFGKFCDVFWLPDTFGYSAQLPQLIRQANMKYFLTQKLSWNLINKFPHKSFVWEGLDGSQVLTHFPPANTYNANVTVKEVVENEKNNSQQCVANSSLMLFGNGDGGGGPKMEMLERAKRMKDTQGLSKVKLGFSPCEVFHQLENVRDDLPEWVGELYFELHRGTYTTHGLIKKQNRTCERLLRDLELLSVLSFAPDCEKDEYINDQNQANSNSGQDLLEMIEKMWKVVLLNQFHDILPGTSIEMAMNDAKNTYQQVIDWTAAQGQTLLAKVISNISSSHIPREIANPEDGKSEILGDNYLALNTLSWDRTEVIERKIGTETSYHLASVPGIGYACPEVTRRAQKAMHTDEHTSCSSSCTVTIREQDILKWTKIDAKVDEKSSFEKTPVAGYIIENSVLRVEIYQTGQLAQVYHINSTGEERPILQSVRSSNAGSFVYGNSLLLFDDVPLYWDAWDVELYHLQKFTCVGDAVSAQITVQDPLRCSVEFKYNISEKSSLSQIITVNAQSRRVEFSTQVEWHETHKLLKVHFPINVRANQAHYEMQYGYVSRPTHSNTTHDLAKFEVCGHRWASLQEEGFGVALLNTCKYGYSCHKNSMCLSLLRGPTRPDANADMGHHSFKYALYPYEGSLSSGRVVQEARSFNVPLLTSPLPQRFKAPSMSWITSSHQNIIIDVIKFGEPPLAFSDKKATESSISSERSVIIRLFEAYGSRGDVTLIMNTAQTHLGNQVSAAFRCDILEQEQEEVQMAQRAGNSPRSAIGPISFTPFEVITLKLVFLT